jgi:HlyD family secretion protein
MQAEADLAQAEAQLENARVALTDAEQKQGRTAALAVRGIETQADLDAANIAADTGKAGVISAEAAEVAANETVRQNQAMLDQALVNLGHCTITSPIDGIVIQRSVDVGQTVAASVQAPVLFAIAADLRKMQIEVDLDESDVGGIEIDEPATFEVESYPDAVFSGTVTSVRLQPVAEQTATATTVPASTLPATTTNVATVISYPVMIAVDNPDEKLRPGMTATVVLDGSRRKESIRIPNAALSFRPPADVLAAAGQSATTPIARNGDGGVPMRQVWQYDGHRFSPVAVTTGLTDNSWTELVDQGVSVGDSLVTSATVTVHHGL